MRNNLFLKFLFFSVLGLVVFSSAKADFTSPSFDLENPSNIISGGDSSSTHFQYSSTTSQVTQGTSSSASFSENAGFLYFPTATSPVVTATPGDTQVALSWTPAVGILANITNYQVGVSTSSSGVYNYTAIGNVNSYTSTGLTNNTQYFFKIRSYASGLFLSESAVASSTPVAKSSPPPPPSSQSGGGGGGNNNGPQTGANFSGMAYPGSKVFLLKDGQLAASTIAGGDAQFKISLTGLSSGSFTFIVYAEDSAGRKSTLFTFPVTLSTGATSDISGIFIAPTISVDKEEVKKGDNLTIIGESAPEGQVSISIHSTPEIFVTATTDKYGDYVYNLDTSVLDFGNHLTKSKTLKTGEISPFGKSVAFSVGDKTVLAPTIVSSGRQSNWKSK